jgi:hypothetical protein
VEHAKHALTAASSLVSRLSRFPSFGTPHPCARNPSTFLADANSCAALPSHHFSIVVAITVPNFVHLICSTSGLFSAGCKSRPPPQYCTGMYISLSGAFLSQTCNNSWGFAVLSTCGKNRAQSPQFLSLRPIHDFCVLFVFACSCFILQRNCVEAAGSRFLICYIALHCSLRSEVLL